LITTELGVASTLIIFVAESTRTMDALRSISRDLILDVEGAVPVMFSISALRKSCSAAPLLGRVIHSAPVGPSVRPSILAFTETFALTPSMDYTATVIV